MEILLKLINKNIAFQKIKTALFNKKEVPFSPLPLITISREMGVGGKTIANFVINKLGKPWKVYHKEIVDEIAKEANLEKKLVSEVDEKPIPVMDSFLAEFFESRYVSLTTYHQHLVTILTAIAKKGYAVIVGRGANFLFPHALKIRIVADMEQRIVWVMDYEKITRREALRRIKESDKKRDAFIRELYRKNQQDPHHYDLVIKTGRDLGDRDAADIITRLARKRFNP